MENIKRRIWGIILFISLLFILCNYMSIVDFISRRSYETFTQEELTGMFLEAEFVEGVKLSVSEEEFTLLIQNFRYFKNGNLYKGVLTDGREVLVVSKSYMGDFAINEPIRGIFSEIPEEAAYFVENEQVESYVFFCFENYLGRGRTDYFGANIFLFFAGIIGIFLCICRFFGRMFPQMFPALLQRNKGMKRSERDSNFELLRILCMIMIIMQHFGFWGEFDISGEITVNTVILQSIVNAGKIGVNCFIMITGYYCAFSSFKPSKITSLVARVWFYTWGIAIILFTTGVGVRSIENIVKSVFPICSGAFWFITIYLIVYVLSPYINLVIKNVEQEKYKMLLVFLFVIWSVVPSVIKPGWEFSNTGWMIFMYLLGGYFRKYPKVWETCKVKPILYFIGSYVFLMYLTIMWDDKVERVVYHQGLAQKHTVLIVICSVALFVLFKNIHIGKKKIINKIAASTFGVYLIHENPVLNDLLWTDWLCVNSYFTSEYFFGYAMGAIMVVYVVCTLIDMILNQMLSVFNR